MQKYIVGMYIFIECILGIKNIVLGVTTLEAYMVENKLGILDAESSSNYFPWIFIWYREMDDLSYSQLNVLFSSFIHFFTFVIKL